MKICFIASSSAYYRFLLSAALLSQSADVMLYWKLMAMNHWANTIEIHIPL